jgi:hypothetical protein
MIQVIVLIAMIVTPALAQEMRVKSVQGNEAVIEDKTSGKEWKAKEGDDIGDGWRVVTVTDSLVTVEKELSPGEKLRGQMPVGGIRKVESVR